MSSATKATKPTIRESLVAAGYDVQPGPVKLRELRGHRNPNSKLKTPNSVIVPFLIVQTPDRDPDPTPNAQRLTPSPYQYGGKLMPSLFIRLL